VIETHGLDCHRVAPFLAVVDNCITAHSTPAEQEPFTSSGLGICGAGDKRERARWSLITTQWVINIDAITFD